MICHVVASAAESELVLLFHSGQTTIPLQTTLREISHKQPPTPIKKDNATALRIFNSMFKQKNQSNEHGILLGQGSNMPSILLRLLGPRKNQQIGLFYQT